MQTEGIEIFTPKLGCECVCSLLSSRGSSSREKVEDVEVVTRRNLRTI